MINLVITALLSFLAGSYFMTYVMYKTVVKELDKQINSKNKIIDEYTSAKNDFAHEISQKVGDKKTIIVWDKNNEKPLFQASPYRE